MIDLNKKRELQAGWLDSWSVVEAKMNDVQRQPRERENDDHRHQHLVTDRQTDRQTDSTDSKLEKVHNDH